MIIEEVNEESRLGVTTPSIKLPYVSPLEKEKFSKVVKIREEKLNNQILI